MPAISRPPRYCRQREKHRPDRAYVKIDGKRIWLGMYGSKEAYDRYTAALNTTNDLAPKPEPKVAPAELTIAMLMVDDLKFAIAKYGGEKSSEVVDFTGAFHVLGEKRGNLLAKDFGPKAFQRMRAVMIRKG